MTFIRFRNNIPASIKARLPPQTEAIDDDPRDRNCKVSLNALSIKYYLSNIYLQMSSFPSESQFGVAVKEVYQNQRSPNFSSSLGTKPPD